MLKKNSIYLTGLKVIALAVTVTFCFPAYAGFPKNIRQARRLAVDLSHRTDYCRKIRDYDNRVGMVTPCRTGSIAWIENISHDIPEVVSPGELVEATIEWDLGDVPGCPVIYNDVFADWDPDNSLAGINYVYCSPTSKQMSFSFEAPSFPGRYRIRWMHASWFRPVTSFFCGSDGCWETGADPDYMESPNAWMEIPIEVRE